MKWLRLLFLALCVAGLLAGLLCERHEVRPLADGQAATLSGSGFVAGAAVDSFMLKDGALFAVGSLAPAGAGAKDCKT